MVGKCEDKSLFLLCLGEEVSLLYANSLLHDAQWKAGTSAGLCRLSVKQLFFRKGTAEISNGCCVCSLTSRASPGIFFSCYNRSFFYRHLLENFSYCFGPQD